MLVLTRSVGDRIFINNGLIKIQIVRVNGNQVHVGVDAPKEFSILREEVFHRYTRDNSFPPGKPSSHNTPIESIIFVTE